MRNPLNRLRTVRAKLVWIVALVSALTVIALSAVSGVRSYQNLRQSVLEAIVAETRIVAMNASAPLAFRDEEMAMQTLSALQVSPDIDGALLVDADGDVFASYRADRRVPLDPTVREIGHWDSGDGRRVIVTPVADRAGVHGRLQVIYHFDRLHERMVAFTLRSALLAIAAVVLAWLLARGLQPVLTRPIDELERAAQRVRDTRDYSIRARKISDDELGRLTDAFNEMLERIESHERALVDAQHRAEESSRLKDEFVATVSHELRTPLSPVLAWIQMLRLPGGPAKLPDALEVMERNAKALILIIDDLLDMSRIVSGTLRLDVRSVDLDGVVRAAAETLGHAALARGIAVEFEAGAPPPLRGDPARLQQVVWNLLSNAIKFSPDGGRVSVATAYDGARATLTVTDRGAGIEPAFLPHVFDRFRQQDGSITRRHGGLGLGLSIVRQLVELHGGTVTVESEGVGHGARFTVSLPVLRAAPAAVEPEPRNAFAADALAGRRVAVIEDQPDMRALVSAVLEGAGAEVRQAGDAVQAMELLQAWTPDAIVCDIGLPDVDGCALLQQARERAGLAQVPAIALTAYVRSEERARALQAGFALHLAKPVEPAALVGAVAKIIAGRPATATAGPA